MLIKLSFLASNPTPLTFDNAHHLITCGFDPSGTDPNTHKARKLRMLEAHLVIRLDYTERKFAEKDWELAEF